jgi:hypothetical protein
MKAGNCEGGNLGKISLIVLGIASTLLGFLVIPTLLYNVCGVAGMQDCAAGPQWESALVILASAIVTGGFFYLSYRIFRLAGRL